jgi:hypothetical protein
LDLSRFRLPMPETEEISAWQSSVKNAQSQLQHQQTRIMNLELLSKLGPNAWQMHNFQLEGMLEVLKGELEVLKRELLYMNQQRRESQVSFFISFIKKISFLSLFFIKKNDAMLLVIRLWFIQINGKQVEIFNRTNGPCRFSQF